MYSANPTFQYSQLQRFLQNEIKLWLSFENLSTIFIFTLTNEGNFSLSNYLKEIFRAVHGEDVLLLLVLVLVLVADIRSAFFYLNQIVCCARKLEVCTGITQQTWKFSSWLDFQIFYSKLIQNLSKLFCNSFKINSIFITNPNSKWNLNW